MEDTCRLFVDPEEDEVFFYDEGTKSNELGCRLKNEIEVEPNETETKHILDNCSEQNDLISEVPKTGSETIPSIITTLKEVTGHKIIEPNSGLTVSMNNETELSGNCQNSDVLPSSLSGKQICRYEGLEEKKDVFDLIDLQTPTDKKKRDQKNDNLGNEQSIHVDHTYSTPVKSIIDKNILKTPKSVVKADKDGGFLKVLSEIALVKAEADENTLKEAQKFFDTPYLKTDINDDEKENRQSDNEAVSPVSKTNEITPAIPNQVISGRITNYENKKNFMTLSLVKLDKDIPQEYTQVPESVEEPDLESKQIINPNMSVDSYKSCECSDVNDIVVVFDDDNIKAEKEIHNEEPLNNLTFTSENKPEQLEEKNVKEFMEVPEKCHSLKTEMNLIGQKDNLENETDGYSDHALFPQKENFRKFMRRKTLVLLEELNGIVNCEQAKRKSCNGNIDNTLSEEAAKVIEKLKAVSLDDSIGSPSQDIDFDNLSNSFLSMDLSDLLNDTLSKPLSCLTNRDIELLLEKITGSVYDDNIQRENNPAQDEIKFYDAEKENLCEAPVTKNVQDAPEKTTPVKFVNSTNFARTPHPVRVPDCENGKIYGSSFSERKVGKKVLQQPQDASKRLMGSQSVEKCMKPGLNTRIPKLASTASKIPTGSKEAKLSGDRKPWNGTPYPKAQKNLKFSNIESPVQAYINSKTPVLISTVKAKTSSTYNVWMKNVKSATKPIRPEMKSNIPKSGPKPNLGFVKYKSGIPLKLEKSPETRLPKLTPKLQKLIETNSPVTVRHEGRIQLSAPRRPQISMNDTSILTNPNEVSVVVSKFAQKSRK